MVSAINKNVGHTDCTPSSPPIKLTASRLYTLIPSLFLEQNVGFSRLYSLSPSTLQKLSKSGMDHKKKDSDQMPKGGMEIDADARARRVLQGCKPSLVRIKTRCDVF